MNHDLLVTRLHVQEEIVAGPATGGSIKYIFLSRSMSLCIEGCSEVSL